MTKECLLFLSLKLTGKRLGNRLKHFVNFETWGVLVDKHGWITELAVCVFLTFIATPSSLDM